MNEPKLNIGAVVFWKNGAYDQSVFGDERVTLLRKLFRGEDLGEYEARADWYHQSRKIDRDDVNWATAGRKVTGP